MRAREAAPKRAFLEDRMLKYRRLQDTRRLFTALRSLLLLVAEDPSTMRIAATKISTITLEKESESLLHTNAVRIR